MTALLDAEQWLVGAIATCLGIDRNEVTTVTPFASLGLQSRDLVAIGAALSDRLGRELDLALLWQYPSVAELMGFLRTQAEATISPEVE